MCGGRGLHFFEFFALGFVDELRDEEYAERGEERVDQVRGSDPDAVLAGKHREAPGHDEVRAPLGKATDGDGHGADAVVEHFAQHHPHDRAPRCREEGDVEVRGDERDDAGGAGEAPVGVCTQEAYGERSQRDRHADATDKEQRLAADPVDEHDGGDGHD